MSEEAFVCYFDGFLGIAVDLVSRLHGLFHLGDCGHKHQCWNDDDVVLEDRSLKWSMWVRFLEEERLDC